MGHPHAILELSEPHPASIQSALNQAKQGRQPKLIPNKVRWSRASVVNPPYLLKVLGMLDGEKKRL
jgi:hypothetical protein